MSWLATVVLRHESPQGIHYDWLLDPPSEHRLPEGRLWTARVTEAPDRWRPGGPATVRVLPPHRREYLTYEGALTGHRGAVTRLASGRYQAVVWTDRLMVLDVNLGVWVGRVELSAGKGDDWEVTWRPKGSAEAEGSTGGAGQPV